jgi:virginiamycin B lyase
LVTEFPLPTRGAYPQGIAAGSDGNLWFTETNTGRIGRISTTGVIKEFPASATFGITAAGGALWFTAAVGKIGRIATDGTEGYFPIPYSPAAPYGIAPGSDGDLWFTDLVADKIGRLAIGSAISSFPLWYVTGIPAPSHNLIQIAPGADGALWFTEQEATYTAQNSNLIGRISTSGKVAEFAIPTQASTPFGIAAGPDGAIWFTEEAGKIGKVPLQ